MKTTLLVISLLTLPLLAHADVSSKCVSTLKEAMKLSVKTTETSISIPVECQPFNLNDLDPALKAKVKAAIGCLLIPQNLKRRLSHDF